MTTVLPRRHPQVEVAEFETEFVVFDPAVNQVHRVVGIEAAVFEACDGTTTFDELVIELAGPDDDRAPLAGRVDAALIRLGQLGLLEGTAAEPPPPCVDCEGLVEPGPATTWSHRLRRWWAARRQR